MLKIGVGHSRILTVIVFLLLLGVAAINVQKHCTYSSRAYFGKEVDDRGWIINVQIHQGWPLPYRTFTCENYYSIKGEPGQPNFSSDVQAINYQIDQARSVAFGYIWSWYGCLIDIFLFVTIVIVLSKFMRKKSINIPFLIVQEKLN